MLIFPEFVTMNRGLRNGRNIYEGYQRGWGIQFGDLSNLILSDELFKSAYEASKDRLLISQDNLFNLYLLIRFYLDKLEGGDVIEFGSYKGGSAIFMAYVLRELHPEKNIYALDTYCGMPATDKSLDAHSAGDFSDVDYDEISLRVKQLGLDNLILVKGLFEDTTPSVLSNSLGFSLAHIDCDIASGVRYSYEAVCPKMVEGGYIVFDDATVSSCIGATDVVEDAVIRRDGRSSEQIWPHFVFRTYS